jgi:hypothetical protein
MDCRRHAIKGISAEHNKAVPDLFVAGKTG